jgi:crossover junction endodeoxyribonuclease RuvC
MGHARGVVLLAAAEQGLAVFHYAATRIKKSLTGYGRAPKAQVQRAVQSALGLAQAPEPPDVADALATALCHLHVVAHGTAFSAASAPVRRRGAGLVT